MPDDTILNNIVKKLGLRFTHMTIYRAELTHLKNDGLSVIQISELLNTNKANIYKYYEGVVQPSDLIIERLENLFFERKRNIEINLSNPSIEKKNKI